MIQDQLRKLYELSVLDLKIEEIHRQVAHAPERRQELQLSLEETQRTLAAQKERLDVLEKEKRSLDEDRLLYESRLKEFQGKVNLLKTQREYQAALKEIAETKKMNQELQGKIQILLAELEPLKKQVEEGTAQWSEIETKATEESKALDDEEKRVEGESEDFRKQREVIRVQIDAQWLAHYDRLQKHRMDAVAHVVGGICQGCHMKIPPQLYIEVQRYRTVHTCPSCQRILYLPGGTS